MSLFDKLITLARGTMNDAGQTVVDRNAIPILEQEIRDAQGALAQARVDLTRLMAERKVASDKLDDKKAKCAELTASIQALVNKGNQQDLAREVAGKVADLEHDITGGTTALAGMDSNIAHLQDSIQQAGHTIEHLTQQVDTVKATASVQHAQEAITAQTSGSNAHLQTALASLERLQEQQKLKDAQLQAAQQLDQAAGDGGLTQRLQAAGVVPGATSADDVLARFSKTA